MKCFAICKLDGTKVRSCMNWKRGQLSWLQTAHASSKISAALGVCVTPEVPLYSRFSWTTKVLPTVCIIFVCFSLCSSSVLVLCTLGLNSWWKMVLGTVLLMSWEEGSEIPLFELRQEGKTLSSTNPGSHAALCPSGKGFRQSRLLWLECSLDSVPASFPLCFPPVFPRNFAVLCRDKFAIWRVIRDCSATGAVFSSGFNHLNGENSGNAPSTLLLVKVFCKLWYLKASLERRQDCLYRS